MKRIISYNVNGIRAAVTKGLTNWMQAANPDVLCVQEIKATHDQINTVAFQDLGYHCFWHPAQKKGYSGVGILSKQKPLHVEVGCGIEDYDNEGRILRADFKNFSVISLYLPSGSSGDERQAFKMNFLNDFIKYSNQLKQKIPNLIISGDYNICHKAIDIHNPIANANTSGFLPEERAWMDNFTQSGFIDTFRAFNQEPHNYSWWTFRAGARQKNLGWRIDYNMVTESLKQRLQRAAILKEAIHSDHCPVLVELDLDE
ncbi:MAG: exodeoxyribonuclease III [Bacteroidia bacterium]|nr:exodeoxyribonuclease III [Bacteroidia bacterium]